MKKTILLLFLASIAFSCKQATITYNDPIPKHDSLKITSKVLNEDRTINIWTPPNYEKSNDSLSVLYMPDGGIKEDFPHMANTLSELIAANKIPPYILVGIENTDRRKDLSGPSKIAYDLEYIKNPGGSNNFRSFIQNELIPTINKNYRTNAKKAIIGESVAGLFVAETFILNPKLFDNYIAIDPSLWFNEQYLVKNFESLTKNNDYTNKKLWFAGSDAEDIFKYTKQLEEKLKKQKPTFSWNYSDEPTEQHSTIFRATKEKALIWTLNN